MRMDGGAMDEDMADMDRRGGGRDDWRDDRRNDDRRGGGNRRGDDRCAPRHVWVARSIATC